MSTATNGPGSAIVSSRRAALTEAPVTERVPAPHLELKPSLQGLAVHSRLFGTRSGLPTVLCYCLSDAVSIVIALSVVRLVMSLAGLAPRLGHPDPRLAAGFIAAAFILNW